MRTAIRFAFALCLVVCLAVTAFPQSRNTGEIRGTVTDTSGAVVAGATVTVRNIDTGESKEFVTNGDGIYDTVSTRAGNYRLEFSKPGFKRSEYGPIALEVSTITVDATLQVGEVSQQVTVVETGGAPLLQTESGQQGTIQEAQTMDKLPQIGAGITGNDWANFNILLPGAEGSPTAPASEGSGAYNAGDAVSINGNLPNYANYLQDGGVVQLPVSNNVDNTLFSVLQEVQITTSSFSAQYGIGGAVFNQITKGGTNTFHGSAYEYWQNSALDARPFFWAQTSSGFGPQPVPYLRYDEYGGTVGGPILKNKLFFFFAVDKIYSNGAAGVTQGNVPTLAEIGKGTAHPGAYDFTGLPTLYDPLSCNTPGCTRTSFAAENTGALAGVNAIPANRIDPVAAKVLALFPAPNAGAPGALEKNFSTILPTPNPNLRYFGRIDYNWRSNNTMFFSISQKNNPGVNKYGPLPCPVNCFSGDIDGYNAQYTDDWTITPNIVNEFRMAYTKQGNWFVPQSKGYNASSQLGLQYAKADVLPQINIGGAGQCCSGIAPGTNAIYIENLYDPSDVITMIKGKHILHFGVEVLMGQGNTTPWGNLTAGNFTFNGLYTAQNGAAPGSTGTGLADFLLGDVQSWSATNQAVSYARLKSPQLFIQDDYKLKPNLTINLGLRYTATTGFTEIHNAIGGFDPTKPLAYPCPSAQFTNCSFEGDPGSMWFAGQDNRSSSQKPIYNIFLPRVGFAWTFMHNTVLRGGFGMYSYNFSQDVYGAGIGSGSIATNSGSATDPFQGTGPNPLIYLSSSSSVADSVLNYVVGSPQARLPYTYLNLKSPSNQTYVPYNVPVGRINEWQLSVERQFGNSLLASLAYVGSHGYNLQFPTDLNQITSPAGLAASSANLAVVQADRPFPAWGTLGGNNYNAISNYHALQALVTKRYANGLLFSANFTWSHMLDDQDSGGWGSRGGTQYWQIGSLPGLNYGNSNFDIPLAFKGYASYELPFGTGKRYLNNGHLLNEVVGGWRVAGTFLAQSGNPFTVVMNNNENSTITGCGQGGTATGGDVNNGCNWFPNVIANVNGPKTTSEWFNTAAFAAPWNGSATSVFAFGNEGRNILRGPSLNVVNLSLAKELTLTERFRLSLRADFVNALNHPSLGIPGQKFDPNNPTSNNFGQINAQTQNGGVAVAPRSGQLSAVFTF